LITIFSFIFSDFLFCLSTTIIDTKFYIKNKFTKFLINFLIFAPLIIATVILLLRKRRRPCIAAGFLYLIGGSIVWLYKIAFLIYIIVSDDLDHDYERIYSKMVYLICFLINLITIFFRLFSCYLIKKYFTDVCKLEEYIHEKEHAIFIQSLATQEGGFEGKLIEDDEMDEEKLYSQNNPFISGRDKSDEKEDEEIFQTTL
jgi:hypothetical protein